VHATYFEALSTPLADGLRLRLEDEARRSKGHGRDFPELLPEDWLAVPSSRTLAAGNPNDRPPFIHDALAPERGLNALRLFELRDYAWEIEREGAGTFQEPFLFAAKRYHSHGAELPAQSRASTLQEGHPWQTRALLLRSTVALIPPDLGLPWLPHLSPTGNPTQRPLTARCPARISSPTVIPQTTGFDRNAWIPAGEAGRRGRQIPRRNSAAFLALQPIHLSCALEQRVFFIDSRDTLSK